MANEDKKTDQAETATAAKVETTPAAAAAPVKVILPNDDPLDLGLDLENLPKPPWTKAALGAELYQKLAVVSGTFNPKVQIGYTPDLDPSHFAIGRAKRRVKAGVSPGAPEPINGVVSDDRWDKWWATLKPEEQAAYNQLSEETEYLINALSFSPIPTPRASVDAAGKAMAPMEPVKLTKRERRF